MTQDTQLSAKRALAERQEPATEAAIARMLAAPRCPEHGCCLHPETGACWMCEEVPIEHGVLHPLARRALRGDTDAGHQYLLMCEASDG